MAANDILLRQRNPTDDGWVERVAVANKNGFLRLDGVGMPRTTLGTGAPGTLTTAGAGTITAALILTGLINRDPNGGARTDTTDTAANIIAAAQAVGLLMSDYDEISFYYVNTADAAETITLAAGNGVTLQGIGTIAQNSMDRFILFRTSSATLVMRKG